jgi:hypothetical protein
VPIAAAPWIVSDELRPRHQRAGIQVTPSLLDRNEPVWAVEHGRIVGEHLLALAENVLLEVLARLP